MATDKEVKSIQTKQQEYKAKKWDRMFTSRRLITSPAYLSLTAPAPQILMLFLAKCKPIKPEHKAKSKREWVIGNNGELVFTYHEAESTYKITRQRFGRGLCQLIERGFIDIAHHGSGLHKDFSQYAISDRWQNWGTEDFVRASKPKRVYRCGFRKGNRYGRNSRSK